MLIHLDNLLPEGIPVDRPKTSIWETVLSIDTSKVYLLKGTSGRGKSTFLHTLTGIRRKHKGNLRFGEKCTSEFQSRDWAEIRQKTLSVVFQDLRLIPHLTARQNLQLKCNLNDQHDAEKIEAYSNLLNIGDYLDRRCNEMSLGQQQRFAIIRALIQPFHFLLLDEPFSHLDTENIESCIALITSVTKAKNAGFLITTLGDDHGIQLDEHLTV
jgi:ABC-type lipoprotein export system ATPase subunit